MFRMWSNMTYTFGDKSKKIIATVKPDLQKVLNYAIGVTKQDFTILQGIRSLAEQKILVAKGASQTLDSNHIRGEAVDTAAYVNGSISWNTTLYDEIADAMKLAAIHENIGIRWGGAWNVPDIRKWGGTMEEASNYYIDSRRKLGKRPFMDLGHFELI